MLCATPIHGGLKIGRADGQKPSYNKGSKLGLVDGQAGCWLGWLVGCCLGCVGVPGA